VFIPFVFAPSILSFELLPADVADGVYIKLRSILLGVLLTDMSGIVAPLVGTGKPFGTMGACCSTLNFRACLVFTIHVGVKSRVAHERCEAIQARRIHQEAPEDIIVVVGRRCKLTRIISTGVPLRPWITRPFTVRSTAVAILIPFVWLILWTFVAIGIVVVVILILIVVAIRGILYLPCASRPCIGSEVPFSAMSYEVFAAFLPVRMPVIRTEATYLWIQRPYMRNPAVADVDTVIESLDMLSHFILACKQVVLVWFVRIPACEAEPEVLGIDNLLVAKSISGRFKATSAPK
jgi:hypothetical protein